jgi:hypothetical protein
MKLERVHYNCVCDEPVALRCSNTGCGRALPPDVTVVVTPDGTVYCSEGCALVAVPADGAIS